MIEIYTRTSCRSCIKSIDWLKNHHIPYIEQNINHIVSNDEILTKILDYTQTGFDSIIAKYSDIYKKLNINFNNIKISEAKKIIFKNPSILKKPIIIDDVHKNIQIGYNKDDIKIFSIGADHDYKTCPLSVEECRKQTRIKMFKKIYTEKNGSND